MAGSPAWKIYSGDGVYLGSLKDPIHGVMLCAALMEGATVRYGHTRAGIVYTQGHESIAVESSYDAAAEIINTRRLAFILRTTNQTRERAAALRGGE